MYIEIKDIINMAKKTKEAVIKQDFYIKQAKKFADEIKVRTRAMGNSVVKQGDRETKLATLSTSYIHARKTYLSGILYSPRIKSKSCLTLTGEMLDNILTKVTVSANDVKMYLYFDEYNSKKAKWAEDGRTDRPKRPFFHFTDIQIQAFYRDYTTFVTDVMRKFVDLT